MNDPGVAATASGVPSAMPTPNSCRTVHGMPDPELSGHPIDLLIRELIETHRNADPDEIGRILDRIATAEFDNRLVRTRSGERGLIYSDRRLMRWDNSLFVHLVRRVVGGEQWAPGTTAEEYVHDLRRAPRVQGAALAVYARRGGSIAAVLAPTALVVPAGRLGSRAYPTLTVIYSADRGIIVTGYQAPSRAELAIPEVARWLL